MTEDETFTRFRRKLADAVTVAINSWRIVSAKGGDCCPLGTTSSEGYPLPHHAARSWGLEEYQADDFMRGFDDGTGGSPHSKLGQLYRARFP